MPSLLRTLVLRSGALLALLLCTLPARAHVGSKDVFETIDAGPYKLFVTVRVPTVIPGVATIELRASGPAITSIRITPIPLTGEAAKHPPTADVMHRSPDDPGFYTGSLWLMASGSWQVRFNITGAAGPQQAGVPIPAAPLSVMRMQRGMGIFLACMGLLLLVGFVGVVTAAVREARLHPGEQPSRVRRHRAIAACAVATVIGLLAIYGGNKWWDVEAAGYAADVYHPLVMRPALAGNMLDLAIGKYADNDPGKKWKARSNADLLPDHDKLMHLYAIRWPQMDAAFHLHPIPNSDGTLETELPSMPPGTYRLFGDIVHLSGFPETLTASLDVPVGMPPAPLAPDDAEAFPPALNSISSPGAKNSSGDVLLGPAYKLPDGYTMVWDRPSHLTAGTATLFHFHLLDPSGHPATGVVPYLGMAGHAAFVKTDGTVFAHTHPEGSASMPAMMLANAEATPAVPRGPAGSAEMSGMSSMDMGSMHAATAPSIPPDVDFPYGFPTPGRYRIFIQMKHGATVETGVFDAQVN